MAELKPCPFCGGRADLDAPQGEDRMVYCIECCASICDDSNTDAIAAWNRRVSPPGAPAPQPELTDAAKVLVEFACSAPGRLPSRVQEAVVVFRSMLSGAPAQAVQQPKRHSLCGKCMTPHICAEDGPGCKPVLAAGDAGQDSRGSGEAEDAKPACNPHPDAPHGFNRNASHNARRYVCDCEGWEPEGAASSGKEKME